MIKLAVLDKDINYLNRIGSVFGAKYADKIRLYAFTDMEVAFQAIEVDRLDVLVASNVFEIDFRRLPKRCGFAYFVEAPDIETVDGKQAICKFQKAELIYKEILSIYSENVGNVSGLKLGDDSGKTIVFMPVGGGTGASSMAAACAIFMASKGKKTLYLNLEKCSAADTYFAAAGQFNMSDIIYALIRGKANLAMKLESCVKKATNGVYFYEPTKNALDMLEMNNQHVLNLISELQLTGGYDYIIVDTDFSLDPSAIDTYRKAHHIVWVGDGSENSNMKIVKAYNALNIMEQRVDSSIVNRLLLIYNKFSNKSNKGVGDIGLKDIGGAPRYTHASVAQVLQELSTKDMFENLM